LEKLAVATLEELNREAVRAEKAARGREASRLEVHRLERWALRDSARRTEQPAATE
jgi:hypothetical protein